MATHRDRGGPSGMAAAAANLREGADDRRATAVSPAPISSVATGARQVGYRAAAWFDRLMAGQTPPAPPWVPPVGVATRRRTDVEMHRDPAVGDAVHLIREHCGEGIRIDHVLDSVYASRTLKSRVEHLPAGRGCHSFCPGHS